MSIIYQPPASFHLPEVLAERITKAGSARKRVRTRLSLIAAAATEMEEKGYEALTIDGIVERAGVARGTFYLYFDNKKDIAAAVKRAFDALLRQRRPRSGHELTAVQSIYRMNRFYVACYARNAQIAAGHEALLRELPELSRSRDYINHRWAGVILRDLCKRQGFPPSLRQSPKALLAVRAVIAMADELLRETFVFQSPRLAELAHTEDDVAEVMTFIWYRSIFGHNPAELSHIIPPGSAETTGARFAPSRRSG